MDETQRDVQAIPPPPSPAVPRLSLLQRLKTYNLKKLLLVCTAIGVGLGVGIVGVVVSIAWYLSRPIAATEWDRLDIPALSLKARLKTDWNGQGRVRYQFWVKPRSQDLISAFSSTVQSNRGSILF